MRATGSPGLLAEAAEPLGSAAPARARNGSPHAIGARAAGASHELPPVCAGPRISGSEVLPGNTSTATGRPLASVSSPYSTWRRPRLPSRECPNAASSQHEPSTHELDRSNIAIPPGDGCRAASIFSTWPDLCEIPEGRTGRPSKALTLSQAESVLKAAADAPIRIRTYIVLSLLTGARTEELRELSWSHVVAFDETGQIWSSVLEVGWDHKQFAVYVWRSVRKTGDTKTVKSRRSLQLPDRCVEALKALRAAQERTRSPAGEKNLVFRARTGTALSAGNVRRDFRAVLDDAGLVGREWTHRELRHSFVSLQFRAPYPDRGHLPAGRAHEHRGDGDRLPEAHPPCHPGRCYSDERDLPEAGIWHVVTLLDTHAPPCDQGGVLPGESGGQGQDRTADLPLFSGRRYHAVTRADATRVADLGAYRARSSPHSQSDGFYPLPLIIYNANAPYVA